jgi:uncharacterized OsmC-like protein
VTVRVVRDGVHRFTAVNERGAVAPVGRAGKPDVFSPGELLQAAVAACAAVTAEELITRRAGDQPFVVHAEGVSSPSGHEYTEVPVTFELDLSTLDADQRAALAAVVRRAIEQLCTVSRTLERGAPSPLTFPD